MPLRLRWVRLRHCARVSVGRLGRGRSVNRDRPRAAAVERSRSETTRLSHPRQSAPGSSPYTLGNFGASDDPCRGTLATKLKMRLRSIASLNMPQLSVEVFVDEMERLGLRLGVTRLADGKVRLNRWQTPDGVVNAQRIDDLWATQIGDSVERIDELTEYLLRRT
jgi:hypothetical protein